MVAQITGKTALVLPAVARASASGLLLKAELFEVAADTDFSALVGEGPHLVFQSAHWLSTWFAALDCKHVLARYWVTFRDNAGEPIMGLPLVLRQERGLRMIEIPDCGVSDYQAPVFYRPESSHALRDSKAVWTAMRAVLPPADLLRFEGLQVNIDGVANPLVYHPLATPNRACGWQVTLPENWEDYIASLSARHREKLAKAKRRFLRQPGARIAVASNAAEARDWLEHLDHMQLQRLSDRGLETQIASTGISQFYRMLAETGISTGEVMMAGLFAENEVVAINFAVRSGNRATYLRVANIFGPWSPMTPGLLVTEHMMHHAHANGVRIFDFGLGEYDYKKRFGGMSFPLIDIDVPLAARGLPFAAASYLRRRLRGVEALRRLTGRKSLKPRIIQKSDD